MAKQSPIQFSIWDDPDFEEFKPYDKLIFLHLITNKRLTKSGIFLYTFKAISDKTGIEKSEVKEIIQGSLKKSVEFDEKYSLIWVKNRLKYNIVGNPKVILRTILKDYHATKRSNLWEQYWEYNREHIECLINKSEKLKRDICAFKIILPDRLQECSSTIRQLLLNSKLIIS